MADVSDEQIRAALRTDRLIDIITVGARTQLPRTTEIWFTNIGGQIYICGVPREKRDWLANLMATPAFAFRLKESVAIELPARAHPIRDTEIRRSVLLAPETQWYRDNAASIDLLLERGPVVAVHFTDPYTWLNEPPTKGRPS